MADTPRQLLECLNALTTLHAAPVAAWTAAGIERTAGRALNRVPDIFEDPNIIGVGISEKLTDTARTGVLSVCFYVEKKLSKARIPSGSLVPPVMASTDGTTVLTDVKAIGRVRPEGRVNRKASPVQSGFSVGHVAATAGTVGAIVRKGKKLFLLSNAHVLAESGRAMLEDTVLYPGRKDGGTVSKHRVGTLAAFVKFKVGGQFLNRVDAALCAIAGDRLANIDPAIYGVAGLPRTVRAKRGMVVITRGRTSGETEGVVEDVNFRVTIDYPNVGPVGFFDQVLCTRYSRPGDSGALVVDKSSQRVVGLHFAGAGGGSVFNPIADVKKALEFAFVRA